MPGWRWPRSRPDEVVYGVEGTLLTARLVVSVHRTDTGPDDAGGRSVLAAIVARHRQTGTSMPTLMAP